MKKTLVISVCSIVLLVVLSTASLFAVDRSMVKSDPVDTYYDDASPQFNEQGFFTGSSFSNVGEAIVNNYNGNLIYNRNLYIFEGEGGFDANVTLTYNGSVSHTMVTAYRSYSTGDPVNNLSFNTPEWILGVNGIGVQVFNFENEMYSWFPKNGPEPWYEMIHKSLSRDSVALIIAGYHMNIDQRDGTWFPRSSLSYLLADGSANTVFNDKEASGATVYDDGYCQGDHIKDRTKGWSELTVGGSEWTKEYWIKPGDGTTIFGKSRSVDFKTGYQQDCIGYPGHMEPYDTVGVFVPDSIYDGRGNVITLTYMETYEGTNPVFGRPLLTRIELNHDPNRRVDIDYHISGGAVTAITIGEYEIDIRNRPDGATVPSLSGNNNRGYLTKITDPQGRETSFDYERYVRGVYDLRRYSFRGDIVSCYFSHLTPDSLYPDFFRLSQISDYTGAAHQFKYFNFTNGLDSLDQFKYQGYHAEDFPHDRYQPYFDSLGRDPFFTNMVTSASVYTSPDAGEQLIVKDTFEYAWYHVYDRHEYMDSLFTYRYTDSTADPTIGGSKTRYAYGMYPYSDETYSCSDGTCYELSWQICLLQEANEYDTATYYYDKTGCQLTVPAPSPGCSGSFRLIRKVVNKAGKGHEIEYDYELAADGLNYRADTVFMPLGTKHVTTYEDYFHPVIDSTSQYFSSLTEANDTRDGQNNALLSSTTMSYYTSDQASGYKGQLKTVSKNLVEDGVVTEPHTTTLAYWTTADEGFGNIKSIRGPESDSVRLYYDLETRLMDGHNSNLEFDIVDTRGNSRHVGEWVPNYKAKFARLEKFVEKSGGLDTLRQYRVYDKHGLTTRLVDASGNLSLYEYDDAHRIERMVLPGSFDTLVTTDSVITTADMTGFANEYIYDDTAGDGSYTHATIRTRLDLLDTICTVNDSLLETTSILAKALGVEYEEAFDTIRFDQLVDYTLRVPMSSECGSNSWVRVYRNDVLIDELLCGTSTIEVTGSFQAYEDDSITVKANCTSPETDVFSQARCDFAYRIPPLDTMMVQAEVTGIGDDSTFHIMATDQTVDYRMRLIYLPSANCSDAWARIYNGATLIAEVDCSDPSWSRTGSFSASAGDSIALKVHASSIEWETIVWSQLFYYEEGNALDTVDAFVEQETRHEFDGLLRLTQTDFVYNDESYDSTQFRFTYMNNALETIDQLGYSTEIEYDKIGRETRRTFPDSSASFQQRSYGSEWVTNLPSAVTQLTTLVDPFLETTSSTDENGNTVTEYRDSHGQRRFVKQTESGDDLWTVFDYDELGNMTLIVRPEGDSVQYQYNSLGQLEMEWSSDYDTIQYRYDKAGRNIARRDQTMSMSAGGADSLQIAAISCTTGGAKTLESSQMVVSQDGWVSYTLTISGSNAHPATDARIKLNGAVWDNIGNCTSCSASGTIPVVEDDVIIVEAESVPLHDPMGQASALARHFIPATQTADWMYYEYDDLGRTVRSGIATSSLFDVEGTLSWSDFRGFTPINFYFYDQHNSENSRGRLSLTYTNQLGHNYGEKYDYDAAGRLARKTCYYGASLDSTLISGYSTYQFYLSGTQYVVDMSSTMAGQVRSIDYPGSTNLVVNYRYDERGRVSEVGTNLQPNRFATLSYTPRGELQQLNLGNGAQVVDYAYNARGWLNSINGGTAIGGDKFGEQLYYFEHPTFAGWSGQFNGNVMAQRLAFDGVVSDIELHYIYDDIDRLTEVKRAYSSFLELPYEEFTYDDNGNRTEYLFYSPIISTDYFYAPGTNLLDSVRTSGVKKGFTWNALGALTHDDRHGGNYVYDEYNQLEWVQWPSSAGTSYLHFDYGVDGHRVAKTYKNYYWGTCCPQPPIEEPDIPIWKVIPGDDGNIGQTEEKVLDSRLARIPGTVDATLDKSAVTDSDDTAIPGDDGEYEGTDDSQPGPGDCYSCIKSSTYWIRYIEGVGNILSEFRVSTTIPKYQYIYAGDQRIAMYDGTRLHFVLNDHLGSTRVVMDSVGTVKDKYEYYAFGDADNTTTSTNQPYRYTGMPIDEDRNFDTYYYGARWYDPLLGRFTSIDPKAVEFPSITPYLYSAGSPLKNIDPNGEEVYFYGPDAKKAAKELDKATSLKIKFDKKTGKITAEGKAKTAADKKLKAAIDDKNVKVKVTTTKKDTFKSQDGGQMNVQVGTFDGSTTAKDGSVETIQVVNIDHAKKVEKAGGATVGQTVLHETNESYIGGLQNPGKPYSTANYNQAHNAASKIDPPSANVTWTPKGRDTKGRVIMEISGPKGTVTLKTDWK